MVRGRDAAPHLAAPLLLQGLDLTQPLRVLDACAAPGGKTAHLLEYAGPSSAMQVTALEVDSVRSARIHETLHRIGLHAQVLVADAPRPPDWRPSEGSFTGRSTRSATPCPAPPKPSSDHGPFAPAPASRREGATTLPAAEIQGDGRYRNGTRGLAFWGGPAERSRASPRASATGHIGSPSPTPAEPAAQPCPPG